MNLSSLSFFLTYLCVNFTESKIEYDGRNFLVNKLRYNIDTKVCVFVNALGNATSFISVQK